MSKVPYSFADHATGGGPYRMKGLGRAAPTIRIRCSNCGAVVCSTPVPADTVIRAWVECPECLGLEAAGETIAGGG